MENTKSIVASRPTIHTATGPRIARVPGSKSSGLDAPMIPVLAKGTFEISVKNRDPFYTGIFYLALSLIVMGVGFLKPNISSLVGQLYPQTDPRRDAGFTIYYMGINLGAFAAPLVCGWLAQSDTFRAQQL